MSADPSQAVAPTAWPAAAAAFEGPLFVVGMPRSGTKLLRDLLNGHSCIGIPCAETEFLPWLVSRVGHCGDLSERANFDRLYAEIVRKSFFTYRANADRLISADRWFDACERTDPAGIFEALIRVDTNAPRGSGRIWGDKSPSYIDDLPLINRLYPEGRVLHMVRDVRDYCVSMQEAWGKDVRRAAQRWADEVLQARRDGQALGARYAELRYEDLLREPEAALRRACAFIGVAFEPKMLELTRPSENIGRARGARHVVRGNHGKFAEHMPPKLIADVEALAGPAMQAFGYEPMFPLGAPRRLSRRRMLLAQVRDGLKLVRHRQDGKSALSALMFHLRYFNTTRL
ncbi:MAG: sulfotransferase [Burkholderiales bacterium]